MQMHEIALIAAGAVLGILGLWLLSEIFARRRRPAPPPDVWEPEPVKQIIPREGPPPPLEERLTVSLKPYEHRIREQVRQEWTTYPKTTPRSARRGKQP
jgi:hypothetical protein